jgi:rubredoxin
MLGTRIMIQELKNFTAKVAFGESPEPTESYDGWTCPSCGLGLTQSRLKDKSDGTLTVRSSKRCNWCGWGPDSEPDLSPLEARERARETAAALMEMVEKAEQ